MKTPPLLMVGTEKGGTTSPGLRMAIGILGWMWDFVMASASFSKKARTTKVMKSKSFAVFRPAVSDWYIVSLSFSLWSSLSHNRHVLLVSGWQNEKRNEKRRLFFVFPLARCFFSCLLSCGCGCGDHDVLSVCLGFLKQSPRSFQDLRLQVRGFVIKVHREDEEGSGF